MRVAAEIDPVHPGFLTDVSSDIAHVRHRYDRNKLSRVRRVPPELLDCGGNWARRARGLVFNRKTV
jgi:hypothetical protein